MKSLLRSDFLVVAAAALAEACTGSAAAPPPSAPSSLARSPSAVAAAPAQPAPLSPASGDAATGAVAFAVPAAVHDVPTGGITLHVEEWGSGTPLVLLHHFGWSGKVFAPFVPELARNHRVLVVDLPGMGASTGWNADHFDYDRAASQVLDALGQLGVSTFQGVGVSSGSITLLEMAIQQPERVERMVLSATTPEIPPEARAWLAKSACGSSSPEQIAKALAYAAHGEEQVRALDRMFCREKDSTLRITPRALATVKARTLVAQGDRDRIFPVAYAMRVYDGIEGAHLWIQPGGGHSFLLNEKYRAAVLRELQAFLSGELDPR